MKKNALTLAIAVVILELIGGMQTYLVQLILPIMASDFSAQSYYGVIMGVATIASMVGLLLGAFLLTKYKLSRLLLTLTLVLTAGAIICAAAPHIVIFLIGSVIRGLAGGALSMTSIGAVALGLSGRARQLTLAFSSASWVVSSVVGPSYAAWVTHLLSWRWAMLLYLPFLLVARIIVALKLEAEKDEKSAPLNVLNIVILAVGLTFTIIPVTGILKGISLIVGICLLGYVVVTAMPRGTFWSSQPRKRALAGMFFLTGGYFAANEIVTLTGHDIYALNAGQLGWIIMGGGLGWALIGFYCGASPALTATSYRLRITTGLAIMALSSLVIALFLFGKWQLPYPFVTLLTLWTIAGIGMGLTYLDTMNVFFEDPIEDDGISIKEMAGASVIVESLSSAMFVPLLTSIVSLAFVHTGAFTAIPYAVSWAISFALAVAAWCYLVKVTPASAVRSA